MPLLRLETNTGMEPGQRNEIMSKCSRILAETTGKPEAYTMVVLQSCSGLFDGSGNGLAMIDIRGIGGLNPSVNKALSRELCGLLESELSIPPERVYLNFTDVPASNWGWKGSTFG